MSAHTAGVHSLHKPCMFVDQPRLAENIGGCIFELANHYEVRKFMNPETKNSTHPLSQLSIHHEIVDVLLRSRQFEFSGNDGHQERRAASTLE